jgi:hypothetical protein
VLAKLQNIDRRIIFALLFICVGFPLIKPLGLPLSIRPWTRNAFELVKNIKAGDKVLVSVDYSPLMQADIHPQLQAIFDQLMRQNVRVVGVSFSAQGARYLSDFIRIGEAMGKKYGEDIVDLGYVPGGEAGLSAFAGDIVRTVPKDARGNAIGSIPILAGVKSLADLKVFLGFCDGVPGGREYVRQLSQYKVPLIVGCVTVSATEYEPYYQSGQMAGLIPGLRGAAEYEALYGKPGAGMAGMDAQSAGHMLIILSVILGNIGMFAAKQDKKKGKGA